MRRRGRTGLSLRVLTAVGALCVLAGAAPTAAQEPTGNQQPSPNLTADYQIGGRDLLEIRVFGLSDLDTSVRVTEAGIISLPLIGDLQAAGLTRAELETAIEEALKRYLTDPQVSVFIREYQSQRVSIIGAVRSPGAYEMVGRTTLLEAISLAGGVVESESTGKVTILRASLTGAPIEVDLDQLLSGTAAYNIAVDAGDTINVVPKRVYFIYVYGQVRTPGAYDLREEITLLQAISLAGGVSDRAAKNRIRILRRQPDGTQDLIQVNLEEIEDGKIADVPIRANDVIIVPETFF